MKHVKMICASIKKENEDCGYAGENLALVLDGASRLTNKHISNQSSDAAWYSHQLKDNIIKYEKQENIRDMVHFAVRDVNAQYRSFDAANEICDFPSAACAIVRIQKDMLEYFVLADCTCLLLLNDGEIMRICDQRVNAFDQQAIAYGLKIRKQQQMDFIDTRKQYQDILIKNRKWKNKAGGYYCISDDETALQQALCGSLPLQDVKACILMSDGCDQVISLFHLFDEKTLFDYLQHHDASDVYHMLHLAQKEDHRLNAYPRLSYSDDATLIYFTC